MLALFHEGQASTSVKASVWFKPIGQPAPLLAVARTSSIDVFHVHADAGSTGAPKLHLLNTFDFPGSLRSLQVVTLSGSAAEAASGRREAQDVLLATFEGAKTTLLGLDPFSRALKTLSMLNFDESATGPGSAVRGTRLCMQQPGVLGRAPARIDPQQRLAAVGVYDGQIAMLPFAGAGASDAEEGSSSTVGAGGATKRADYGVLGGPDAGDAAAGEGGAYEDDVAAAMDAQTARFIPSPYILNLKEDLAWGGVASAGAACAGGIPDHSVNAVRDLCFLAKHDMAPALALLSQQYPASTPRLANLAHTAALTVVSVDAARRRHPVIWRREGLPHDAFALVPVPEPYGGVLVLSQHAVQYFSQYRYAGIAVNAYAAATVDVREYPLAPATDSAGNPACVDLGGAVVRPLSASSFLLAGRDGALHVLALALEGDVVSGLTLSATGINGPVPSTLAILPADPATSGALAAADGDAPPAAAAGGAGAGLHPHFGLAFLGSAVADSVLALYAFADREATASSVAGAARGPRADASSAGGSSIEDEDAAMYAGAGGAAHGAGGAAAAAAGGAASAAAGAGASAGEDEDAQLYGSAAAGGAGAAASAAEGGAGAAGSGMQVEGQGAAAAPQRPLRLWLIDSLPSLAPIADMAYGREAKLAGAEDEAPPSAAPSTELVACSGAGYTSTLSVMHRALRPEVSTELKLPGCVGAWFLRCKPQAAAAAAAEGAGESDGDSAAAGAASGFCVLSMEGGRTRIFHIGEGMVECTGEAAGGAAAAAPAAASGATYASGFAEDVPTLAAGSVFCAGSLVDVPAPEGSEGAAAVGLQVACSGGHQRLVQVHPGGVRLLSADPHAEGLSELLRSLPLDVGGLDAAGEEDAIAAVEVSDPYVLLRLGSGKLRLLRPDASGLAEAAAAAAAAGQGTALPAAGELDLVVDSPPWEAADYDPSGTDAQAAREPGVPLPDDEVTAAAGTGPEATAAARRLAHRVVAACLFRDSTGSFLASCAPSHAAAAPAARRVFAALARRNGDLTVHLLPSWERVFASRNAQLGPAVLLSTLAAAGAAAAAGGAAGPAAAAVDEAGEPCEEEEEGGKPAAAASSWTRLPRTFVRELAARAVAGGPLTLLALTSRDDVHAYAFAGAAALPGALPGAAAASGGAAGGRGAGGMEVEAGAGGAGAGAGAEQQQHEDHAFEFDADDGAGAGEDAGAPAAPAAAAASAAAALDVAAPLQTHLAALPRFIRLPAASSVITRGPAGEEAHSAPAGEGGSASPPPEEALHRAFAPRRLVPFSSVAGWSGWACLTPSPLWLMAYRGGLAAVRMGLPDVTGAGGPTAVPGDALHVASPLTAFAPFSSAVLPDGFLIAYASGHLQFARLPRPAWVAAEAHTASGEDAATAQHAGGSVGAVPGAAWALSAALSPQRVPYGLVHDAYATAAPAPQAGEEEQPQPQQGGLPFACSAAVAAVVHGVAALGEGAVRAVADPSAGQLLPPHAGAGSGISVEVPADLLPAGSSQAGSMVVLQRRLQQAVHHVAYMETASAAAGAAALTKWHARRTAAGAGAGAGGAARLPPTSTQLGCSVFPLYALAVSSPVQRDHASELGEALAAVEAEGGEHETAPAVGPHVELLDQVLAAAVGAAAEGGAATIGGGDSAGAAAHASQLAAIASLGLPAVYDPQGEVLLVAGTGAPDPALEPLEAPAAGSYGQGVGWTVLDRFPLRRHERVLCMREIALVDRPGTAGVGTLLVGTGFVTPRGQDAPGSGRLLVFRVADREAAGAAAAASSAEAGQPQPPRFTLQLACELVRPSPVASLAPLAVKDARHVLAGVGKSLVVYAWRPRAGAAASALSAIGVVTPAGPAPSHFLEPVGFHEGHVCLRDIASVSAFVLYGDGLAGSLFLQWREEDKNAIFLARDQHRQAVSSVELLIHDKTLGLLSADEDGNLLLQGYAPKERGQRLAARADFRLPGAAYRMLRARFAVPPGTPLAARKKFVVEVATLAGGVGATVPLEEPAFRRLQALQRLLTHALPHAGGLNPRLWRALDNHRHLARERVGGILDGALLWRFVCLDGRTQRRLARGVGSSVDSLLETLRGIDLAALIY